MCVVSVSLFVRQSVCHVAQLGFTVRGSLDAVSAKSLWPLVNVFSDLASLLMLS